MANWKPEVLEHLYNSNRRVNFHPDYKAVNITSLQTCESSTVSQILIYSDTVQCVMTFDFLNDQNEEHEMFWQINRLHDDASSSSRWPSKPSMLKVLIDLMER